MTNVIGTANILEAIRLSLNKCTVVMITSDKCYENLEWVWGYRETDSLGGKDPYSASKACAEMVIKSYYHSFFKDSGIKISSVRAGNVIGGGDWADNRIVPDCVKSWSKEIPVEIRNPNATRPWQHVLEPLSGYLRTGQILEENKQISGEVFNFGPNSDQDQTVLELLKDIGNHWQKKGKFSEYKIIKGSSFPESRLLKLSIDKALAFLNWKPVLNYPETVEFVGDWYFRFYDHKTEMYDFSLGQIEKYVEIAKSRGLEWAG